MSTMPRPFRLKVLDALTAQIQLVTPANDYYFDLSASVFRGRAVYGSNDPLPMVSILEPPLAIEQIKAQADNTGSSGDWDLLIQGWVKDDPEHPTDPAYTLVAEVVKTLAAAKAMKRGRTPDILGLGSGFGNTQGIIDMRLGAPVVRPPDETSAKSCFYLIVTLQIAEDMKAPFG